MKFLGKDIENKIVSKLEVPLEFYETEFLRNLIKI